MWSFLFNTEYNLSRSLLIAMLTLLIYDIISITSQWSRKYEMVVNS